MCEFISWIEKDGQVLFLTAKDLESKYGKKTLEGCLDNDFLGHGAIKKFYAAPDGTALVDGSDRENRNFWNGQLPQPIKDAWNKGELDGMLKYLQLDDLKYIVSYAPVEFVAWLTAQKFGGDYEAMKKDANRLIRPLGLMATQDYEAMKKDSNIDIRLFGMVATRDYEAMKKDDFWPIRLVGLAATQDYEGMKKDSYRATRLVGLVATQDYQTIKKGNYYRVAEKEDPDRETISVVITRDYGAMIKDCCQDFETMKKNLDWPIRLAGMAVTQDYEAMKKDDFWPIRLVGLAATQDYQVVKKDANGLIRLLGLMATQDYEAMKKDDHLGVRLLGMAATYNPDTLVRPRL